MSDNSSGLLVLPEVPDVNDLVYQLPYGPGLWDAIREAPNEYMAQVNTITKLVTFSCAGDWTVYLETLLPAFGELFLVVFDFEWDDVLRGWFRPAGIRTRYKMRPNAKSKAARGKRGFALPEWGELVGSRLPAPKFIKGLMATRPWRWFWRIDGLLQRALWYWMVVDVTLDFVYVWGTGLLQHRRCWESDAGWTSGGPGAQSWPANGLAYGLGTPEPVESGGASPPGRLPLVVPDGDRIELMYSLSGFRPIFGRVESVETWIEASGGGSDSVPLGYVGRVDIGNIDDVVPLSYVTVDNFSGSDMTVRAFARASASEGGDTAFFGAARYFARRSGR